MQENVIVGFDIDGILNKGTTLSTIILLLRKRFNEKLEHTSGDFSQSKRLKEIAKMFLVLPLIEEYIRHAMRSIDNEVLEQISEFKQRQAPTTSLVILSGRSDRLTALSKRKINAAGFAGLFDSYNLRPPGYSSAGWKKHLADTFVNADFFIQIDDDPLAGHAILKSDIPNRKKAAFIVNNGLAVNQSLLEKAGVQHPSGLYVVDSVSQALAGIANLKG